MPIEIRAISSSAMTDLFTFILGISTVLGTFLISGKSEGRLNLLVSTWSCSTLYFIMFLELVPLGVSWIWLWSTLISLSKLLLVRFSLLSKSTMTYIIYLHISLVEKTMPALDLLVIDFIYLHLHLEYTLETTHFFHFGVVAFKSDSFFVRKMFIRFFHPTWFSSSASAGIANGKIHYMGQMELGHLRPHAKDSMLPVGDAIRPGEICEGTSRVGCVTTAVLCVLFVSCVFTYPRDKVGSYHPFGSPTPATLVVSTLSVIMIAAALRAAFFRMIPLFLIHVLVVMPATVKLVWEISPIATLHPWLASAGSRWQFRLPFCSR